LNEVDIGDYKITQVQIWK